MARFGKLLLGLAAILAVSLGAILLAVSSGAGERRIAAAVCEALSDEGRVACEIDGAAIVFPLSVSIDRFSLAEVGTDPWLEIHDLRGRINVLPLLAGRVSIAALESSRILIANAPPPSEDDEQDDDTAPPSFPRLVSVASVDVAEIVFSEAFVSALAGVGTEEIDFTMQPVSLAGSLDYAPPTEELRTDLRVSLAGLRVEGVVDAEVDTLDAAIDLAGPLARPVGSLRVSSGKLAYGEIAAEALTFGADVTRASGGNRSASMLLRARPTALPETLSGLTGAPVEASLAADLGDPYPVAVTEASVSARDITASATALIASEARIADGAFEAELADLSHVASSVLERGRMKLRGAVSSSGDLTKLDLDAQGDGLVWVADWGDALGERLDLAAVVSEGGGAVSLSDLEIETGALAVRGSATAGEGDGPLEGRFTVDHGSLSDLSRWLSRGLAGSATALVDLGGSRSAPTINAEVRTGGLAMAGTGLDRIALDVAVEPRAESGRSKFSGVLHARERSLELEGEARWQDTELRLSGVTLQSPRNRLAIDGVVHTGDPLDSRLSIEADLEELGEIGAFLAVPMRGRIEGGGDTASAAGVSLEGSQLAFPGFEFAADSVRAVLQTGEGANADLSGAGVSVFGLDMAAAGVAARREGEQTRVKVFVEDPEHDSDAALVARISDEKSSTRCDVVSVDGRLAGKPVSLARPSSVVLKEDGGFVADLGVALGRGGLEAALEAGADGVIRGSAGAADLPLRYLALLSGTSFTLDGIVDAELDVPRAGVDGAATLAVSLAGLRATEDASYPGIDAEIEVTRSKRSHTVRGVMTSAIGGRVDISGRIDGGDESGLPFVGLTSESALAVALEGTAEPRTVRELAALAEASLTGRLAIDLEVGGTLGEPVPVGELRLDDGRYDDARSGALLDNVNVAINARANGTIDVTAAADDGATGRLAAKGRIDLSRGFDAPALDADVTLTDLRVARLDEAKLRLGGELDLVMDSGAASLTGALVARDVELRIPERLPANIVSLDVREIGGVNPADELEASDAVVCALDVDISVPGPAFIRAKDVSTEWQGSVHVGGDSATPLLDGRLELTHGRFKALGQRLEATRGVVQFDPTPEASPLIDVAGQVERENVRITVAVVGTAADFRLELGSDPAMPQDEILAFLLFGSSVSQLTPVQAVRLTAAVAALANPGGGLDPLGWVRESVGLDRVDITDRDDRDGEESAYALTAGKYVRDGVFVSVNQPLGRGASEVGVEVEVTDNVTVETKVGADASGSVGASWSHDY